MKVKCINTGTFKNVTLDKEYEVLVETENTYDIYANDGEQRTYRKTYFEVVGLKITLDEALDKVNLDMEDPGIYYDNNFEYFSVYASLPSCGIDEFDGLQMLEEVILKIKEKHPHLEIKDLSKRLFERLINGLANREEHGVIAMLSTSINEDNKEIYEELTNLQGHEVVVLGGRNPHSDNDIKAWLIKY
jgi:hypothetical protein